MNQRIFYLESFLIKPERHFIEVTLAVYYFLTKQKRFSFYIIGNKQLTNEVKDLIPEAILAISQTVFEDLENKGKSFFKDLLELDKIYNFTLDDLVIVPTCYENQILAVKKYSQFKKSNMPKIALQFHVLFPPAKDSNDVLKKEFRDFWIKRLKVAFKGLPSAVTVWTTESKELNKDYQKVSGRKVGMLPVPFLILPSGTDNIKNSQITRVGFLGEGRQEKGLIILLKAIQEINKTKNSFSFFIQNNNPRGFSEGELSELLTLLHKVKKYKNVEILEGGIPPVEYHRVLSTLDCVVLPHNPANYIRRVSGILIQASMYNVSSIVSSGTEEEISINSGKTKGFVFPYDMNSKDNTVSSLVDALQKFATNKEEINKRVLPSIKKLIKHNSAGTYFTKITEPYLELYKTISKISNSK